MINSVASAFKSVVAIGSNLSDIAHNSIEQSFKNRLIEKSIKYDDEQYKEFASYIDNQDYDINFDNLYNEKSFFYRNNNRPIQTLHDDKSLTITRPKEKQQFDVNDNGEDFNDNIFVVNGKNNPIKLNYKVFIEVLNLKKNLISFNFENYNIFNSNNLNNYEKKIIISVITMLSLKTTLHSVGFVEKEQVTTTKSFLSNAVNLLKNNNIQTLTFINYSDNNNIFLKIFDKENNYNTIHFDRCLFFEPTKNNPELDVFYSLRVETLTIKYCSIFGRNFLNILRNDSIKNLHLTKLGPFFQEEQDKYFRLLIFAINNTSNLSLLDISENNLTYDQISEIFDKNNSINILHINKMNFQDSDTEKFSNSVLLNNKILSLSYQNNNKQNKYYEKLKIICTGKFKELNFSSEYTDTDEVVLEEEDIVSDLKEYIVSDLKENNKENNKENEIISSLINTIVTNNEINNINLSQCFNNNLLSGIFESKSIQTLILNNNELSNSFIDKIKINRDSPLAHLELNNNNIDNFLKVENITPNLNTICINTATISMLNIFPDKKENSNININLIKIQLNYIAGKELINLLAYNKLKTIVCNEIDITELLGVELENLKKTMIMNNSFCDLIYNHVIVNREKVVYPQYTTDGTNKVMQIFEICTFFNNLYNTQKINLSLNDKQLTIYSLFKMKQYCLNIPLISNKKTSRYTNLYTNNPKNNMYDNKPKIINYLVELNIRNKYQRFLSQTNNKVVFYLNGKLYEDENGELWYPNGNNVPIKKYYPLSYYINSSEIINGMHDILEFDEIDVKRSRNINIITDEDETISRINKDPESASYRLSNQRLKIKNASETLFPALAETLAGYVPGLVGLTGLAGNAK